MQKNCILIELEAGKTKKLKFTFRFLVALCLPFIKKASTSDLVAMVLLDLPEAVLAIETFTFVDIGENLWLMLQP